jgi:succinate-semialdehyde dehydrogenase/glutarate-semialdehyde dehydrogenase
MGCAIAIESVFREAGFPEDVFINLIIGQEPEGHLAEPVAQVIAHPLVKAVTLTGSTKVGSYVAEAAGRAIKKSVLELGGSDPYVILKDADLAKAAESCAFARLLNSGQSCIAAKRFIVERPVLEEFTRLFIDRMQTRIVGNPLDANNTVGPMARRDLRDSLHRQVSASVAMGARLIIGGEIPDGKGFFYPVTALADVRKGMPAFDEELFGPAAAIIAADNEAEALRLAADTIYGLGAAIYTSDIEKGERIAREGLFAGACFVNDFVRSDPRLPFGGINQSGYGRELALYSMREFVNIKTVCVA